MTDYLIMARSAFQNGLIDRATASALIAIAEALSARQSDQNQSALTTSHHPPQTQPQAPLSPPDWHRVEGAAPELTAEMRKTAGSGMADSW